MTIDQLRDALTSQPFQPFNVCLADGRQIRVPSREFIWVLPGAVRTFVVGTAEETYKIIGLLHVSSLDFGGNGEAVRHNGKKSDPKPFSRKERVEPQPGNWSSW